MNVTPQWNEEIDGIYFKNRELYEVAAETINRSGDYGIQDYYVYTLEGGTIVYLPSTIFLVIPDTQKLDPRSMQEKAYDDNKQRDTNYIKVYKERMGIHVFNSYAEEDYYRHKSPGPTPDVGLPEGHTASESRQGG